MRATPGAEAPPRGAASRPTPPPDPSGAATRGLACPDVTQWLREIARVVGPQQALLAWTRASMATSLHGTVLSPDQLETMGNWLLENATEAPLRVAVRSCLVRLQVWRTLERTRGRTR